MRVAVEEIEGVTEATVSLEDGEVRIALAENNGLSLDRLRSVIRDQGFTPRDADIQVRGVPTREEDGWSFRVPGTEVRHRVVAGPDVVSMLRAREGELTVVRARMDEGEEGVLRILSVEG